MSDVTRILGQVEDGDGQAAKRLLPLGATTLEDFDIVREIGRGGTAIVYEATQKSLRRKVALKRLPAAAALDQRWLGRFRNEVRAAAQLNHANIVPFYELGEDDGSYFYTMQLVEGISLAEVICRLRQCRASTDCASRPCLDTGADAVHPAFVRLCERCKCRFANGGERTPLHTADRAEPTGDRVDLTASPLYHRAVAELMRDTALAVDYAHSQGILHLDVKPSNILIDGTGKVWITDFGASLPNSDGGASVSGDLQGTLCYMSPEQALGQSEQLGRRSDVYSLGASLYELLTLERPFSHDSPQALLTKVALERSKPPRRINTSLAAELDAIVVKAMACQPEQRYATARDMANDLEKYLTAPTNYSGTQARATRRGLILLGISVALILVCLAVMEVTDWPGPSVGPVHQWRGHFYALTAEETDWASAEAEAVSLGGHLIAINSRHEQEFVVETFLSPPDQVFWIGLTDHEQEDQWHWVSGEPIRYTNWQNAGEPNNFTSRAVTGVEIDEDYGVINWHRVFESPGGRTGTWNDYHSIPYDRTPPAFRGIMEFPTDPR